MLTVSCVPIANRFAKLLHSGTVFPTLQDDVAHGTEKGPEQTQIRGSSRAPQDMGQAGDASFEERPVPPNGMSLCCCIRAPRQAKRPSQLRCWAGRSGGSGCERGGADHSGNAGEELSEPIQSAVQEQKQKDKRGAGSFTVAPAQYTCRSSHATMSSEGGKPKVPSIGVELRSPFDASAKRSRRVSKQFGGCFCQEARCRR